MAKNPARSGTGKSLVIVESPAKARTISRFLGPQYAIEASIGHIRDLPQGAKEMPAQLKGESWAYLGVNVGEQFEPVYVIPKEKTQQVRKLRQALKDAKDVYLATDEDREGEAISWHLCEVLRPKVPVHRLVFHEITDEAIREALKNPRQIDQSLVHAQEVRRIVDRLYGYDVSPLLWRKIRPKLSAGRVQSVAVRLIVERERSRMRFRAATYWDLLGTFAKQAGERFQAALVSVDGRRIPASRDFDPATGRLKDESLLCLDESGAQQLLARLERAAFKVDNVEDKPYTTDPYPPFTTSTLQQEANRKYGFTARHTMQVAQSLYETGHITYMRTDSTNLAAVAVGAARNLILAQYGREFLPERPRTYASKVKNAQEAHEAIRPAGHPFDMPDALRGRLSPDEFKLYDLIWKRTIASQMTNARGHRITIAVGGGGAVFQVSGRTIEFPGYLRAYVEGSDDPEARLADQEDVLPKVTVGESLSCGKLESKSHTTQPPNRYSEASLTRELERLGIGRPSTYASIIDTILARRYVFKIRRGNVLVPTWTAFAVCQLMEKHLAELVDYQFTAEMEDELDAISRGEMNHVEYLKEFYFGNDHDGLKQLLAQKIDEIDAREVSRIPLGKAADGQDVNVRVGRYGPFVEHGERRASVPDQTPPDELTLEKALELLEKASVGDEPLGVCPETGKPVFLKTGRFGPYVQRGTAEGDEKPQNASLLKGMEPEDVTVELALKLLSLPRKLGLHPETGEEIVAHNGRYGPYVKCGDATRSLPDDVSPLDATLQQAVELLAQPKGRRKASQRREPIKALGQSPVTGNPVQLLDGRYGPYVTDGETNASLPRGAEPAEITLELALHLLKERAERGPTRRAKRSQATGTRKKATKKKATKKKAAKKTTRKKSKETGQS
ncbi:MAG: type I DNA topoisomerase [Thermoguttaceae bacterium]|jgi:DNA topoisomerase-1|nr:type I DNA topoisomerase [Thermoguttaceae bacterium]